jgi:DNA polymerase III subunit epsilon
MREIIFDTETTGLSPNNGDRLVEIGCIEMLDRFPTGRIFHKYINPERDMPLEAFNVHGLSSDFLKDQPLFAEIADELWEFLDGAQLVAHNASFDMGFINAEFARTKKPQFGMDNVIDTVMLARRKFPGARVSLDQLCDKFGIDRSRRTKHGALLDAEILAEVYSELLGGKQTSFGLDASKKSGTSETSFETIESRQTPLQPLLSEAEIAAHREFTESLGADILWNKYIRRSGQ